MKKILIILLTLIPTGCWNYKELNDLAITTGLAIDKKDDLIEATVMIANSQKENENKAKASNVVYSGIGETVYDALKDAALKVSKEIYFGHIEIIIISEELAKEGISKILDFVFRYPQVRNDFYIAISNECSAKDLLKITTPLETISSQNIAKNIKITNKLQGYIYSIQFIETISHILTDGINPVIPSLKIVGNINQGNKEENVEQSEPETYVKLDTLGIFYKDKLITFANKDESKGINIINNKITTASITINYNDIPITLELTTLKTKIDVNMKKVTLNITAKGSIEEVKGNIDLIKIENINKIQDEGSKEIKKIVSEAIKLAQNNKTDIFGFGKKYHEKGYKNWDTIKEIWDEKIFTNLEPEINVILKLEAKGNINNSIGVKHE